MQRCRCVACLVNKVALKGLARACGESADAGPAHVVVRGRRVDGHGVLPGGVAARSMLVVAAREQWLAHAAALCRLQAHRAICLFYGLFVCLFVYNFGL